MDKQAIIQEIIKELVDKPEEVSVEELKGESAVVLNIKVAKGDLGKVIGRKGRIISALRTLFGSIFAKDGQKAIIEVND